MLAMTTMNNTATRKTGVNMTYEEDRCLEVLTHVDGILLDYIERIEKMEGAGLYHGRAVALAVKEMMEVLKDMK